MPNKWTGNDRDLVMVCQFVFAVILNNRQTFSYLPSLHRLFTLDIVIATWVKLFADGNASP
jgi:hypothetical protein